MKKYLVRSVNVATEENVNFKNQNLISYYGKKQKMLACCGTHAEAMCSTFDLIWFLLEDYGYDTISAAKRSWIYKNSKEIEDPRFWSNDVSIVEVNFNVGTGYVKISEVAFNRM